MHEIIGKLLKIQETDARILSVKARLEAGPREIEGDEQELARHRTRYEEGSRRAKEAARAGERKNGELENLDRKMKDLDAKLMMARSNKEYDALKNEIAGLRADYGLIEEEALTQWAAGEEREKEAGAEKRKMQQIEAVLADKRNEWRQQAGEFQRKLEELQTEREAQTRGVPESWMNTYEKVLVTRGVPVVVEVVEQYCQGCQMNVTIHDVTRALRNSAIVQCRACNRILYAESL